MFNFKATVLAAGVALAVLAPHAAFAQDGNATPITISEEDIALIAAACSGGDADACLNAVQTLTEMLSLAHAGVSLETILGTVTAELAASANTAIASGNTGLAQAIAAATSSVRSVAETAGVSPTLIESIAAVSSTISSGNTVDLQSFAQANGREINDILPSRRDASPN